MPITVNAYYSRGFCMKNISPVRTVQAVLQKLASKPPNGNVRKYESTIESTVSFQSLGKSSHKCNLSSHVETKKFLSRPW